MPIQMAGLNTIYHAFSDNLKSNDKSQSIWHESMITLPERRRAVTKCIILNKNSYDPTLSIAMDTHMQQYKLSHILNENSTHILKSFHMDSYKVDSIFPKNNFFFALFVCMRLCLFTLFFE